MHSTGNKQGSAQTGWLGAACAVLVLAAVQAGPARADSLFDAGKPGARDAGLYAKIAPDLKPGDVVKIHITEDTTANVTADSHTKDQDTEKTSFSNTGLLGRLLHPVLSLLGGGNQSYDNEGEFKGNGTTDRQTKLQGTVTALVADKLDNGNLIIEGRKRVHINNEEQTMVVRGVINPLDLDSKLTIDSDLVADVEIEYLGDGQLSKKTKPNFLSRLVDTVF
jgi:flagellar L-ring protein precursor FlgH